VRIALICLSLFAAGVAAEDAAPAHRSQARASATHDKAFWREVAARTFTPPAGEPLPALVQELSGFLASPDPELRDDIGYSGLVAWIYRQRLVPPDSCRTLMADWQRNLTVGIGERGTDSVFRRSFSALALGIVAILDNEAPFLTKADFDSLLASALTYLNAERDIRGFEESHGWMHSVAHTADLLKFLARSRYLDQAQQGIILQAVIDKLGLVDEVLTHGEDERLARAVLSIAARSDLDETAFARWATGLPPPRPAGPPTPAGLARAQNRKNLAVALYAVLSADKRNAPTIQRARDSVLAALKTFM
jgi:hypothetical protein